MKEAPIGEGLWVRELPNNGGIRLYIAPSTHVDIPAVAVVELVKFLESLVEGK